MIKLNIFSMDLKKLDGCKCLLKTYILKKWADEKCWVCGSYPEGAPLTKLKHTEHTVLKFHCAVELSQVVVVDT